MLARKIGSVLARLFPTRVRFHDASFIEWLNREAILYVEQGRSMEIPWTFQATKVRGRTLRRADIARWDPPNDTQTISEEKKQEICSKVDAYCKQRRIPLEIK